MSVSNPTFGQRLVHVMAWATTICTFLLLLSGSEVTSKDVGMAVADWPTTFGHSMFTMWWFFDSLGVRIEHRHRVLGMMVGFVTIAFVLITLLAEPRRWVKWYAVGLLAAVCSQGVLGGQRVQLNALFGRNLAAFHGVSAQLVFAMMAAAVVMTSQRWRIAPRVPYEDATSLRRMGIVLLVALGWQIVFGAILRHLGQGLVLHLGGAGLVLFLVLGITLIVGLQPVPRAQLGGGVLALGLVTLLQLLLGIAAWFYTGAVTPGFGREPSNSEVIVTILHVVTGALLVALTLNFVMGTHRYLAEVATETAVPVAMESAPGVVA